MARNRDLKGIQDGRSRVRQTGFESRESCRTGVRIYGLCRVHRLKRLAGCRDQATRLARTGMAYPFYGLGASRNSSDIKMAILDSRLRRSGTGRPTTARKGHDRVYPLRPKNMKRISTR
jgi:hypothetical protein